MRNYPWFDVRNRAFDRSIAAYMTSRGVAFTLHPEIEHININGDLAYHKATFKITATGEYLDCYDRVFTEGESFPARTFKGNTTYQTRLDTRHDVLNASDSGPFERELSIIDTIRRIWFQNDAETIDATVHLIFRDPYRRKLLVHSLERSYSDYFSGLVHPDDPVFSWAAGRPTDAMLGI